MGRSGRLRGETKGPSQSGRHKDARRLEIEKWDKDTGRDWQSLEAGPWPSTA